MLVARRKRAVQWNGLLERRQLRDFADASLCVN
jgi:hypothetical protein